MKKLLIMLIIIFLCTGCYDYKELNNLAIISGISIDYNNNKYDVCYEVLNEENNKEISDIKKTFYVDGSGKTLSEAFENANLKLNRIPFFSHIKVIVLSKSTLDNHTKNIIDYVLRDSNISNMAYVVYADNTDARSLLKAVSVQNKIVSESIYRLIKNKNLGNSLSLAVNFEDYTNMVLNNKRDLYLPVISLNDNILKLEGIAIFSNNKFMEALSFDESATLNILLEDSNNSFYKYRCDNNYVTIDIRSKKIKYDITNKILNINIKLLGTIKENNCNIDDNLKLEKEFEKKIKTDIEELLKKLQNYNSDVLGINYMYYKNTKKTLDFKKLSINIKTSLEIDKNGLIFEVNK